MKYGDATAPHAQGAAWVGTAPLHHSRSVQSTMLSGEKAEFQKVHPSATARTKVVVTCTKDGKPMPSPALDRTKATYSASQRHASKWQSMYSSEICKIPRQ
jgi:hypothetical protein